MSIKENREVYTILWLPAAVITVLDSLPRAHDDDFTPVYINNQLLSRNKKFELVKI